MSAYNKFKEALDYLMSQPKYRLRAQEIAKERGLLNDGKAKPAKGKKRDKVLSAMVHRPRFMFISRRTLHYGCIKISSRSIYMHRSEERR